MVNEELECVGVSVLRGDDGGSVIGGGLVDAARVLLDECLEMIDHAEACGVDGGELGSVFYEYLSNVDLIVLCSEVEGEVVIGAEDVGEVGIQLES